MLKNKSHFPSVCFSSRYYNQVKTITKTKLSNCCWSICIVYHHFSKEIICIWYKRFFKGFKIRLTKWKIRDEREMLYSGQKRFFEEYAVTFCTFITPFRGSCAPAVSALRQRETVSLTTLRSYWGLESSLWKDKL